MNSRRSLLLLLLCMAVSFAAADAYRDGLVAKVTSYQAAIGNTAPVYPALAKQLVADYGITKGVCVDVGSGPGTLGMALAKVTDLTFYELDIDPYAVRLCNLLVDEAKLVGRVRAVEGDATDLPFRDNFAELVVSRGSIFFWPDQFKGLMECYRILKPGGVAYIGGGFSRILDPAIRDLLAAKAHERIVKNGCLVDGWKAMEPDLAARAQQAGAKSARLLTEPVVGWWIELRK